jgi:hypothetical protein
MDIGSDNNREVITLDATQDFPPSMCYAPNPKRTKSVFGQAGTSGKTNQARDPRLNTTAAAKTPSDTGKYLNYCKELNRATSSTLRMVYLRQFRGEVYVGIRNIAPHRGYVPIAKVDTKVDVKPLGLFMPLDVWRRLCSEEIKCWVNHAVGVIINESGMHDAQVWHCDPVDIPESHITVDGEWRAPLGRKKWVTVKMYEGNVYVGLREFFYSAFLRKSIPGRGINLNTFEWEMLETHMEEVNEVLASL